MLMAGLFNSTTVFNSLKIRFLCILSCSQYNKDTILKAIHNILAVLYKKVELFSI